MAPVKRHFRKTLPSSTPDESMATPNCTPFKMAKKSLSIKKLFSKKATPKPMISSHLLHGMILKDKTGKPIPPPQKNDPHYRLRDLSETSPTMLIKLLKATEPCKCAHVLKSASTQPQSSQPQQQLYSQCPSLMQQCPQQQ